MPCMGQSALGLRSGSLKGASTQYLGASTQYLICAKIFWTEISIFIPFFFNSSRNYWPLDSDSADSHWRYARESLGYRSTGESPALPGSLEGLICGE